MQTPFRISFRSLLLDYGQLPAGARRFLIKATLMFVAWKGIYILVLLPQEIPDAWLIRKTAEGTCQLLNIGYSHLNYYPQHLQGLRRYGDAVVLESYSFIHNNLGQPVLGIFNSCTALELMILYTGFILCFSAPWLRKLLFSLLGILGIYMANILRSSLLVAIKVSVPVYFDMAHKYLFNLVLYVFIFLLWMAFVRSLPGPHHPQAS